jgi:TolB-like protein
MAAYAQGELSAPPPDSLGRETVIDDAETGGGGDMVPADALTPVSGPQDSDTAARAEEAAAADTVPAAAEGGADSAAAGVVAPADPLIAGSARTAVQRAGPDTAETCEGCVAVLPFTSADSSGPYTALSKGLCDMLITDLSQVERLTLVERSRMQALYGEIALGRTGLLSEEETGRTAVLLGARTIVQGAFKADSAKIFMKARALGAASDSAGRRTVRVDGALEKVMWLEKDLAFAIVKSMGIVLTDDERRRIETVPTENVLAFLAYSKGLDAEDRGDFDAALEYYRSAVQQDGKFDRARQAAKKMEEQTGTGGAMAAAKAETEPVHTGPEQPAPPAPVFTSGGFRLSASGPASALAINKVNAGFMPDRSVRASLAPSTGSGRAESDARVSAPQATRNSYSEAFGAGLSGGGTKIKAVVPIPDQ